MRVTAENDSPEFRERLREVEDVLDGTRAWTKRVSDKSRAVTKALGSLTEAMEGFVRARVRLCLCHVADSDALPACLLAGGSIG